MASLPTHVDTKIPKNKTKISNKEFDAAFDQLAGFLFEQYRQQKMNKA